VVVFLNSGARKVVIRNPSVRSPFPFYLLPYYFLLLPFERCR
jgi:hypothetical protein